MSLDVIISFLLARPFLLLIIILAFAALYIIIRIIKSYRGPLKYGEVISADHTNWRTLGRPLFSERMLLTGMPDYIIDEGNGCVAPVEVKSAPWRGIIYDNHRLQLAGYMLLVEECLHKEVRHGIIMYGDGTTKEIPFTPALQDELLETIAEMRNLQIPPDWRPNPYKCRKCSMRLKCNMAAE